MIDYDVYVFEVPNEEGQMELNKVKLVLNCDSEKEREWIVNHLGCIGNCEMSLKVKEV